MKRKWMIMAWVYTIIWLSYSQTMAVTENVSEKTLAPYFHISTSDTSIDSFPLKSTSVKATVSGVIADVTVTQKYSNQGSHPINARYIFPASTRAAVHGMTMTIGDRRIKAVVKEKKDAKKSFEQAKSEGKSASLLQQHRPNVFSMNVANIMPGNDVDIELQYTEFLVPTDGVYEFVFPTVVGPRYANQPEATAPENDLWVKNPYLREGTPPPADFQMAVTLSTGIPLQDVSCNTHNLDVSWSNSSTAGLKMSDGEKYGGNRDFMLHYRLSGEQIESGLLLHQGEDENFFALMMEPPERTTPELIPAREYIFVVDVSGSMNGFPLTVSKILLHSLISSLRPTDTFNVVLFAGGAEIMSPKSLAAEKTNIDQAIRLINHQRGGGGTELKNALKKALALPKAENTSRTIVIVTDGYISAEREVFELISNNLNQANLFSFGIGSSVNRYLIEAIAKAGLGEPFVVTQPEFAPGVAEQFRRYIESPVLSQIQVEYDGFDAFDITPHFIPDMFAQRPVIVFGKWRGKPTGTITVRGVTGKGIYQNKFDLKNTAPSNANHPLQYLWARKRIETLSDYSGKHISSECKQEITSLGLTYHLLTRFTSFVAVSETIVNPEGNSRDVKQPLPLPKNVSNLAVGGSMARVPEPELWILMVGFGVVMLTMGIKNKKFWLKFQL